MQRLCCNSTFSPSPPHHGSQINLVQQTHCKADHDFEQVECQGIVDKTVHRRVYGHQLTHVPNRRHKRSSNATEYAKSRQIKDNVQKNVKRATATV